MILEVCGMTLFTNQVFHGGLWGTLHNKSVKPKLELTDGKMTDAAFSFDVFRTEGVDVYGAWIISMELSNEKGEMVWSMSHEELSQLPEEAIHNYYVARVKPGKHSLVVPLGAKANIRVTHPAIKDLPRGSYQLILTDISGASWKHTIVK